MPIIEVLGELEPDYELYKHIVQTFSGEPDVLVPWNPQVAADKVAEAIKKLSPTATAEEFDQARDTARFQKKTAVDIELLKVGLVGSLRDLFEKVVIIEETDGRLGNETLEDIHNHLMLPVERRRGAKIYSGMGMYYWGGSPKDLVNNPK